MFLDVLALAMGLQGPVQVPPPAAPLPPHCDIRVQAVDYRTGKPIAGARIRLRDLAQETVKGKHSARHITGPDGLVCFDEQHPVSDGLLINANSLQYRDPGPELLIATRPQEFTVHLRRRSAILYLRYLLVGD